MCQWTGNFSWTFWRAYRRGCWNILSSAWKWIWSFEITAAEVLPFWINAQIISQNLFHTKPAMRKLAAINDFWSFSLCWTNKLGRREAWCGESCFVRSAIDRYWEWSSHALMSNDTDFGNWNKLIRVLIQIIHIKKVINACNNIECQALKNSWVALQYRFSNILRNDKKH